MHCRQNHRHEKFFENLPLDQGGAGRHRCAGCAYEQGYTAGMARAETFQLRLDELPESQAGAVRHRSPHAAFAQGYLDGVTDSYG